MKTTFLISLFAIICSILPQSVAAHPFHVSMCEIHYNEESQSLEIALKLFVDDLNLSLSRQGVPDQYFGEDRETVKADSVLNSYIQQIFKIQVDKQAIEMNYLGKDFDNGALWTYFEIRDVAPFEVFTCSSSLFFDIFDDQQNIIQLNYQGKTKSLLLHKRNPKDQLSF